MTASPAQLIIPRLTWDAARGFDSSRATIERGLALGVGGFMLGPAPQEDVRALTKELRSRAKHPLLVAADVERGAGQIFSGATGLPPLAAIAALNEPETLRKAARLTGREARNIGVNWALAPVLDLDLVPDNPIVGSRSLGANAETVSRLGEAWIEACQQEGVLACAKHFPGHGRTTTDSHLERAVVRASRHELMAHDLQPFRAAIKANVASVMTAHVFYPALDPGGALATLSMAIVRVLLRERLGFENLVVTDSLDMRGLTAMAGEGQAAVGAIFAGCDLVLSPTDLDDVAGAMADAVTDGTLDEELLLRSQRRRLKWAQWASPPNEWRKASTYDISAAADLAERVVRMVRGGPVAMGKTMQLQIVDDDATCRAPGCASSDTLVASLRAAGIGIAAPDADHSSLPMLIAVFGDVLAGKGRVSYSADTVAAVDKAVSCARSAGRPHLVLQFGHPRVATELAGDNVATAWNGDRVMQDAASRWLYRGGAASAISNGGAASAVGST
jgi:beta-glucosidase